MKHPWIDLSAHNLSLWRFGEDQNGIRSYVLLPIFPQLRSSPVPEDSIILQKFSPSPEENMSDNWLDGYNSEQGWLVWHRDLAKEPMIAAQEWLRAFPGALFRERDSASRLPWVRDAIELHAMTSFLRNPWAWSPNDLPDDRPVLIFANEEQAAVESPTLHAAIRSVEEIDPRAIRELPESFPCFLQPAEPEQEVEPDHPMEPKSVVDAKEEREISEPMELPAAELPAAEPLAEEPAEEPLSEESPVGEPEPAVLATPKRRGRQPKNRTPEALSASDDAAQSNTSEEKSGGRREDYGEYVPGSRKGRIAKEIAILAEMVDAARTEKKSESLLETLAQKTKASVLLGEWKEPTEGEPWKTRVLKDSILEIVVPSARSLPWDGKRTWRPATDTLMNRIEGYKAILEGVKKRVDDACEQLDGEVLKNLLFGTNSDGADIGRIRGIIPTQNWIDRQPFGEKGEKEIINSDKNGIAVLINNNVAKSNKRLLDVLLVNYFNKIKEGISSLSEEEQNNFIDEMMKGLQEKYGEEILKANIDSISTIFEKSKPNNFIYKFFKEIRKIEAFDEFEKRDDFNKIEKEYIAPHVGKIAQLHAENWWEDFRSGAWVNLENIYTYVAIVERNSSPEDLEQAKINESNLYLLKYNMILEAVQKAQDFHNSLSLKDSAESMDSATNASGKNAVAEKTNFRWKPALLDIPPETGKENAYRSSDVPVLRDPKKDVTEQMICDTFGFRAVQYGKWMTEKDRQEHLNAAFDSCSDLVKIFGFSDPKMVSLPRKTANGERQPLAIALGARGSGRFSAHFERDQYIFNFTKPRGAGSFLHEWAHAADSFFASEIQPGSLVFASELNNNPFYEYVTFMKKNVTEFYEEKDFQREAIIGWNATAPKIWEGLLGEKSNSMWEGATSSALLSLEDKQYPAAEIIELDKKANKMVEKYRQDAVKNLSQMMDDFGNKAKNVKNIKEIRKLIEEAHNQFVEPFYYLSSFKAMYQPEEKGLAFCAKILFNDDSKDEAYFKEKKNTIKERMVSLDSREEAEKDFMTKTFLTGIRRHHNLWNSYVRDFMNDKTPLDKTYKEMLNVPKESAFYRGAKILGEYWQRPTELVARAVSAIGYDALKENGIINTYLTDHEPGKYSNPKLYRANSDPDGKEREEFSKAFFEKVLPSLKEKLEEALTPFVEEEEKEVQGKNSESENELLHTFS